MDKTVEELVNEIFEEIKRLPDGTEISTAQILDKLYPDIELSTEDLFKIEKEVRKKSELEGIILDKSKYDGAFVGLPFNIPFIKNTKK